MNKGIQSESDFNETCPICGASTVHQTRYDPIHYKDQETEIPITGYFCTGCEGEFQSKEDRTVMLRELSDAKRRIDGSLLTEEVQTIRKDLNMKQNRLSELLGGGHNYLSRLERGETVTAGITDVMLRLLRKRPEIIKDLEKIHEEREQSKRIA